MLTWAQRNRIAALVRHGYLTQQEALMKWGVGSAASSSAGTDLTEIYAAQVLFQVSGDRLSFQQAQSLLADAEDKQQAFRDKLAELLQKDG